MGKVCFLAIYANKSAPRFFVLVAHRELSAVRPRYAPQQFILGGWRALSPFLVTFDGWQYGESNLLAACFIYLAQSLVMETTLTIFLIGMPGGPELLILFLAILLLFGARKIPELARGLGRGIREFKDATKEVQQTMEAESRPTPQQQPPQQPQYISGQQHQYQQQGAQPQANPQHQAQPSAQPQNTDQQPRNQNA